MPARKGWKIPEERILIENYHTKTIAELVKLLDRNQDSINAKIKRLKAEGRLDGGKTDDTIHRALIQRNVK